MKLVHIFDIDVTIANNTHRARILEAFCPICLFELGTNEKNNYCSVCDRTVDRFVPSAYWEEFSDPQLVAQDTPVSKAIAYMNKIRKYDNNDILFVTGRDESLREVTDWWLRNYFNIVETGTLYMRSPGDEGIPAPIFKSHTINRIIKEHKYKIQEDIFMFYEDEIETLKEYQKMGIVFKCPQAWDVLVID